MTDAIVMPTHPRFKNLEGQKFGRWSVLAYAGRSNSKQSLWRCVCECGTEKIILGLHIVRGTSKSCGCFSRELTVERNTSHKMSKTPEYNTWTSMKQRCFDPKSNNYENYGGRGITVCDRWKDSFENFLEDMGRRAKGHSIEREDNDGPYCKANCVWATRKEQARNKRNNRMLTHDGRTQCVADWAEELQIRAMSISRRLWEGWSTEDALRPLRPEFRILTLNEKSQTIPEWAEELGMLPVTLYARLRKGWSVERALTTPVQSRRKK